jgi:hypothetical protein
MIALLLIATIELQLPPCRPDWLEVASLESLLAVETSTPAFSQLALSIPDCETAPEQMQVTITSSIGSATRVVSFTDIPRNARLRALAVSIGELDIEPIAEPPPRTIVAAPPIERPIIRTSLSAAAGTRIHPAADTYAFRLQAGLTHRLWIAGAFSIDGALDLAFAAATRQLPQGGVRLFQLSAGGGAAARWRFDTISFGIGPHLEVGWGYAGGSAASEAITADSAHALVGTAALVASFRWAFADSLGLMLALEGGLMLKGIEAAVDGETQAGWRGAFTGATAGLYFEL